MTTSWSSEHLNKLASSWYGCWWWWWVTALVAWELLELEERPPALTRPLPAPDLTLAPAEGSLPSFPPSYYSYCPEVTSRNDTSHGGEVSSTNTKAGEGALHPLSSSCYFCCPEVTSQNEKDKSLFKSSRMGKPPPLRTNSDTLVLHDFRNKTKEITWNADQLKNINLRISWRYISLANKVMLQCNIVTISYHSMTFFLSGQIPISSSNGMFDDLDDLETGYEVCSSENSFIHIYMEALTVVWRHNIRYMISRNRD